MNVGLRDLAIPAGPCGVWCAYRSEVRRLSAVLLTVLAVGCGGNGDTVGPSLSASSDSDGVLHVAGSGWTGCPRVEIALPDPWRSAETRVEAGGRFSLVYARPEVMPYRGVVRATCSTVPELQVTAEIHVGDSRSRE